MTSTSSNEPKPDPEAEEGEQTAPADWFSRFRAWAPFYSSDKISSVEKVTDPHDALRIEYIDAPVSGEPDTFVLYRIIGNDLHPRHRVGQSVENLKFILRNEPVLDYCEKRWIVNRITDSRTEAEVLSLLDQEGQRYIYLPFMAEEYSKNGLDYACLPHPNFLKSRKFGRMKEKDQDRIRAALYRHKNNYVMNNNGARNAALAQGCALAKWVLPFDGNCFFTPPAWRELIEAVEERPWLKYFVVPMARVLENRQLLQPGFTPPAQDEPQLIFRKDAKARFNEAFPYGRRPKVELFWHLGIPGPWDEWKQKPSDQPRRPLFPEADQFGTAGWVARLFSGMAHLESGPGNMPAERGVVRQKAILAMLENLDEELAVENRPILTR